MKVWLVGLGLALLFCIVNSESECSGDYRELQGKWHVTAVGSDCKHFSNHEVRKKMLAVELSITKDNKYKILTNFPKKDGCKKMEMEFEKRDDGTYFHESEQHMKEMQIVDTDCESFALFVVKIHGKEGKDSKLVAMYTKEPNLPDHLKKKFLKLGWILDLEEDQMTFPKEVVCQNEE